MCLFSRRTPAEEAVSELSTMTPIAAFWQWWDESGSAIDPSSPGPETDRLTELVGAIHPDLTWHFGPGADAEHRLTVTASGDPDVRPHASRWHRAAPDADERWEFAPSTTADPRALSNELQIGEARLELSRLRFGLEVSEAEQRVHVEVFHPEFRKLPEGIRTQVAFLVVDWALGEDELERWVGLLDPVVDEALDAVGAEELRAAVAALSAERDPDRWMVLQGEDDRGRPMVVSARSGLRWIDEPTRDLHHVITVPFHAGENGLPESPDATVRLERFEDELVAALEPAALLMARQTVGGRRLFHLYTDGEDSNAADRVARFAAEQGVGHEAASDPGWRHVRPFTG